MILVIAEQKDGKLNRASWETIAAAQQLSGGTMPIKVAVAGQNVAAVAAELSTAAVAEVITIDHAALAHYTPDAFVQALQQVVTQVSPAVVMLPHTYQTRDFSPTLATRLDRALVTDVIAVKGTGASATFARPMFQGKLTADVAPQGAAPHFVTIQIGAFRADQAAKGSAAAPVASASVTIDESKLRQKAEAPFQEAKQAVDLSQAERIVSVGRGIKSQENIAVAEQLAKAFGAELAASRPICDNGWLPMERQIGSSGQTVAPKLYVALGISGAIQHLVGMKGSRTIVAINKDADAPIFEVADYGIQGDLFELAPAIIAELQKSALAESWKLKADSRMAERETLEVDVLIVGAGPAGLSAALRIAQMQKAKGGDPLAIAVIEKAPDAGRHQLSGALLDPSTLKDLIPDFVAKGAPLGTPVDNDNIYFLTEGGKFRLPITPPPFQNHGNYIISLSQMTKWLAEQVEAEGIDLFWGFPGQHVLYEAAEGAETTDRKVVGVRTGDRGIGKDGQPKGAFEPGADIRAKVTIFADGVRGHLTKQLYRDLQIGKDSEPAQFAIGIKELWDIPKDRLKPGTVIHTLGYPLREEEFGGSWLYAMGDGRISIGFVTGLEYRDPLFDPHAAFQHFKRHPFISSILEGGQLVRYGAKALPEGGWNTQPQLFHDGALIVGDAANFVNSTRLKGIHLAMRSGMLAGETAFDAVRAGDASAKTLSAYKARVDASAIKSELHPVRNVHQAFGAGLLAGSAYAGIAMFTNGHGLPDLPGHAGHKAMRTISEYYGLAKRDVLVPSNVAPIDRKVTFDKVTGAHYSGTHHDENQPVHLQVQTDVCHTICGSEYGHPCVKFCPANVYEMVDNGSGGKRLQINASNCVHCKTCDIMDPYGVINWVAPEGGEGPSYEGM